MKTTLNDIYKTIEKDFMQICSNEETLKYFVGLTIKEALESIVPRDHYGYSITKSLIEQRIQEFLGGKNESNKSTK
jgi:hypothetical protein